MTKEQYESLPLTELKEIAKARGLKGTSIMKKADCGCLPEQDSVHLFYLFFIAEHGQLIGRPVLFHIDRGKKHIPGSGFQKTFHSISQRFS